MLWTTKVLRCLTELVVLARSILKVLRLRTPGLVFLRILGEDGPMLKFVLVLPEPGANDVKIGGNREVVASIDGVEPVTQLLSGDAMESEELSGEQGQTLNGTLVDIDDAGNRSEPREFSFVLTDTLAPPQPGELGLRVTAEE